MNKRGFVRMIEVLLSVVAIMAFLTFMSEKTYTPTFELRQNPTYKANDILDLLYNSGILEEYLQEYDLKSLDSYITYLLPVRTSHKLEIEMTAQATLEETSGTQRTDEFGFTYNFPEVVDKNSIFVSSETELMDRNVIWPWYKIPLSFENNRTTNILQANISLENVELVAPQGKTISNDSFAFFFGNDETVLEVNQIVNVTEGWYNLTANITVNIPFLKSGSSKKGRLFYATSETTFNNTKRGRIKNLPNKLPQDYIKTLKLQRAESTRGDVLFRTTLNASSTKNVFLTYSLNTKRTNSYNTSISQINSTDVTMTLIENNVKEGYFPLYTTLPLTNVYSSSTMVPISEDVARVKLYVWFIN